MGVEIVKVEDFERIAKENEYFIWHFTSPKLRQLTLRPYYEPNEGLPHPLKDIVDRLDIPYFESVAEESIDFIINLRNGYDKFLFGTRPGLFNPTILGFKRRNLLYGTWEGFCYCDEGFINLIYALNPDFFANIKVED